MIPNLYSCDPDNKEEAAKALAVNQLAGVLSDLELVRWPKRGVALALAKKRVGAAEKRGKPRQRHRSHGNPASLAEEDGRGHSAGHPAEGDDLIRAAKPLRNHGLFSKAERALQIAGWSERARNDVEIFRLVDTEGLTPLLMVLNEPRGRAADEEDARAA